MSTTSTAAPRAARSRSDVPYLPGLDGMRALAVVAVMIYHANAGWLSGGFLGVEVFFVISGYLITLLLIGEHERTGRVSLRAFWMRRARRLLPALFTLLVGITIYAALFRRDALGQMRGDVIAALTYVSNWYQIWVGQGYTASGDFAPLRHLWSLAVEEQFYVLWPLVMAVLLRLGRRRLPSVSWTLVAVAVAVTAIVAVLHHDGPVGTCELTPDAYWQVGERCISKMDFLYLSTPTRSIGLLLGAAFAMVWRPVALMRGPMRRRGRLLDGVSLVGLLALGVLCWRLHVVTPAGADPWLFRGGFLLTGIATLFVIAAVTHRRSVVGRVLGMPALVWIGTRSYGLYLFHWPIYQGIRRVAGNALSFPQFVVAMIATVVVTELSFRFIETPVRRRTVGQALARARRAGSDIERRVIAAVAVVALLLVGFAGTSLATAPLQQNEIAAAQQEAGESTGDPFATTSTVRGDGADAGSDSGAGPPAKTKIVPDTTDVSTTTTADPAATTTIAPALDPAATTVAPPVDPAATTVAPTATATPTTTTVAPAPPAPPPPPPPPVDPCLVPVIDRYAVGDSVMLGAAAELNAAGFCVDAVVSRAFINGLDQVIRLHTEGRLGSIVVVALGTNGPIADADLARMMTELAAVPRVIVVTTKADRGYVAPNNDKLRALPATYPNVRIVDWATVGPTCPGNCFYDDGIHLRPDGRRFYADNIIAALA